MSQKEELLDGPDPPPAAFEEMAKRYPHILEIAMAATHGDPAAVGGGCDEQFEFALDLLLDGFERLRDQGWTSQRERTATLPAAEQGV